jgi:Flp pilus assembly protein CpaB
LAALFAALLVRIALPGLVEAWGEGTPVVALTREVQAGAVLQESDLDLVPAPAALVPKDHWSETAAAVGKRVFLDLPAGTVLHSGLLEQDTAGLIPSGRVAAAVRLSDPAWAGLLAKGDLIDIMASAGASASGSIAPAQVLARSALVVGHGKQDSPAAKGLGENTVISGTQTSAEELLLVAVTPAEAKLIGGAASWATVTAVLVGQEH